MALFCEGMACPLCGKPMLPGQAIFGTWGIWLPADDPLVQFCDASMHWDCYADWPERTKFAKSYVDFWIEDEKRSAYFSRAYLDEYVFVTGNPHEPFELVWVHLYDTGSRFDVSLKDWESWLSQDSTEVTHPVEASSLAVVKEILRTQLPTRQHLLQAIELEVEKKRPLFEEQEARWPGEVHNPPPTPCPFCNEPLRTAKAKQCYHCGAEWHDPGDIKKLKMD